MDRAASFRLVRVLRGASLLLVVLLLLNPRIPRGTAPPPARGTGSWVLVDLDLSMAAAGPEETGRARAVARSVELAREGYRLAVPGPPGAGPEGIDTLALARREPVHPAGDLLEAVLGLVEAGADTIRILSTFRLPEGGVERLVDASPVPLVLEAVSGEVRNVAVVSFEPARPVPAGAVLSGRVLLAYEGTAPADSAGLTIHRGEPGAEVEILRSRVALPEGGRYVEVAVELPPAPDPGEIRHRIRAHLDGDGFAPDDERVTHVAVGPPREGILLVSLAPDWEPRSLLPVLEESTGLGGTGLVRVGPGRFLALGTSGDPIESATPAEVVRRIRDARLVVLHGAGDEVGAELREAVEAHPRVVHMPSGGEGTPLAGAEAGEPEAGEWRVDPDLPPSPVAPFLEAVELAALPALERLLPLAGPLDGQVAVRVRQPDTGRTAPLVVLLERSEGRRALVLASGMWRWQARPGLPRRAYRGLWAGVADWLLARPGESGPGVRPTASIQPRGDSVEWVVAADAAAGGIEVRIEPEGGGSPFRHRLEPDEDGRARTPPLPPGVYRYRIEGLASEAGSGPTGGRLEIESWAPSLIRPSRPVPEAASAAGPGEPEAAPSRGRPLRTSPVPWTALLILLSAEWIWRRRLGLG